MPEFRSSLVAVAPALVAVVVVTAALPEPAISCHQGEFNNQQGREVATEGSGVGTDERMMMLISDGRCEVVGVGQRND
jgi:hypothetical protein